MKRSKNIEFTGRADFSHSHRSYRQLEPTEPRHHIIRSCMLQLFEAGLPIPRTDFTPCSEYSLSPIVVGVSSLPTSYMSFYIHLTSIHPSVLSPQDIKTQQCDKRNSTDKRFSARRKLPEAAGFNFTSYKGRQVSLKDVRNGNCYDCCM